MHACPAMPHRELTGKALIEFIPISACRGELADIHVSPPNVYKVVLGATDDVLAISTEGGLDLTAGVEATFVLA